MSKVDFDDYVEDYNRLLEEQTSLFSSDVSSFASYKVEIVRDQLRGMKPERVHEFGCGIGRNIPFLANAFPDAAISGSDISDKSLEIARAENAGSSFFREDQMGGQSDIDLIFVAGVFHHIPPLERGTAMASISSQLREGGSVFVFEHNPYNPVTQRLVSNCPYDEDAVLLKPQELRRHFETADLIIEKQAYALFVPHRLKQLVPLERYIGWLPLGGQYWIHARKP